MANKQKLAVVLMNLGGPDSPQAIRPFLYNLFSDPAIIPWPNPFRSLLAWIISRNRSKKAEKIYNVLGGRSPLYENTQKQAKALKIALNKEFLDFEIQTFIAMRYWHPFIHEAKREVLNFNPDKVILLPLYPQFSGTTTGSSFKEWSKNKFQKSVSIPCYFDQPNFIEAYRDLILEEWGKIPIGQSVRLLFSAHGLPKRNILQGDPYQWQVEQTVARVMELLEQNLPEGTDYSLCYQSKVGKLDWIGPSLDEEIDRAASDRVGVLVIPIAFVSEHSETLVELDVDYAQKSRDLKIPYYARVPTVMDHKTFIKGLVSLIGEELTSRVQPMKCPEEFTQCGCRLKARSQFK